MTKSYCLSLIVVHLLAFVVMAGYRYRTKMYYLDQASIARELADLAYAEQAAAAEATAALIREKQKARAEKKKKIKQPIPKKKKPKPPKNETNPLERYTEPLQNVAQTLARAQESVRIKTEELKKKGDVLQNLESNSQHLVQSAAWALVATENARNGPNEDNTFTKDDLSSALEHWKALMSLGSLREIPDDALKRHFDEAVYDIVSIVDDDSEHDDGVLQNNYRNELAKRFVFDTGLSTAGVPKEASGFVCPVVAEVVGNDKNTNDNAIDDPEGRTRVTREMAFLKQNLANGATESDLEHHLQNFEEKFRNRIQTNGVDALFPESIEILKQSFSVKLENILDEIYDYGDLLEERVDDRNGGIDADVDVEPDKSDPFAHCIDEEVVNAVITAGLNAQTAHTDVRDALRKTILELDDEASDEELILDADLDSFGEVSASKSRDRDPLPSINLRELIDSPLLMKSIDWVDVLVDIFGGYNDDLDQYLDSLTMLHGTNSVGEILVESLLERAGKIGDVDVEKYVSEIERIIQKVVSQKQR